MAIPNQYALSGAAKLPATGLAAYPFEQPIQLPTSPLRLPFSTEEPTAPLFQPPRRGLPEQPLKPSPVFGAENLAAALALIPLVRGAGASLGYYNTVRRYTLLWGKASVDIPFYAAFFASPFLAQKFNELENQILSVPTPRTTVGTGSVISNLMRPEPTELDLQNAFDRAMFGTSAAVSKEFSSRRAFVKDFGPWVRQPVGFTREEKIFEAFQEGLQFRPLVIAQSEIAAGRAQALLQFVRQMQLFGVFSGTASGGAFPGEQGDP